MAFFSISGKEPGHPAQIKSYENMTENEIKTTLKQICDRICKKVTSLEEISNVVKKELKELGYSKEPEIGAVLYGAIIIIEGPKGGFIRYEFETKKI